MKLVPTEEQEFLTRTARDFAERQSPIERMRAIRDGDATWDRLTWKKMVDLGWTGVHMPEELGGIGLGFADLCAMVKELGRTLAPEPLISTTAVCASGLQLLGTSEQHEQWLRQLIDGTELGAFAHDEPKARYRDHYCSVTASADDDSFILNGIKAPVPDAGHADFFIVSARTSGEKTSADGITLFLVRSDAAGLSVDSLDRLDGRDAGHVTLTDVRVEASAMLGQVDAGAAGVTTMLDRGRVALAAEMLGAAETAFDMTLTYLKEREQFGAPIGSFQALQHRAAYLLSDIELAKSAVVAAANAVDQEPERASELASLAKAICSDMFVHVTHEGVQMHGGIGVTDEHNIGLFLKRARVTQYTWGDAAYHRQRWATLRGY